MKILDEKNNNIKIGDILQDTDDSMCYEFDLRFLEGLRCLEYEKNKIIIDSFERIGNNGDFTGKYFTNENNLIYSIDGKKVTEEEYEKGVKK